jgi:hypothetical protein
LSRDCRRIVASDCYRGIFPTRMSPQRAAMPEFDTTAQACRLATSVGGVLTGRGADLIVIDDPLKPEAALTAFPNGKHDDRVDSTAQLLDWFKGAAREPGGFDGYYRGPRRKASQPRRELSPCRYRRAASFSSDMERPRLGTVAAHLSAGSSACAKNRG